MPVGHPRGAGEVAPRALPRGHAEDLAAPLEERPLAGRGEAGVAHLGGRNRLPARPRPVHVAGYVNLQRARAPRRGIQLVQIARLLVDHHPVPGPERLHVEVGVPRQLALRTRARIVRPHVAGPVPFGHVVHHAVHPHRVHVPLAFPRGRGALPAGGRDDADRLRLPAPVVAPLRVPVTDLLVGDVFPVRRHPAQVRLRERERRRQPARRRHGVELPQLGGHGVSARLEEDLAVRRPPLHHVGRRMPGESPRLAARGGHQVDVGVAAVLSRKRDPPPVRAESRIGLSALGACEPYGVAPVAAREPQVVGVHEDDVRRAHVRLAQEAGALGPRHGGVGGSQSS